MRNKLKKLGIDEGKIESTIDTLHEYCFRKDLEITEFLSMLDSLINLTNSIGIPIENLKTYVLNKSRQLLLLIEDISDKMKTRNNLIAMNNTTAADLEEFRQLRPIHEKLLQAWDENNELKEIIKQKDIEIKQLKDDKLNRNNQNNIVST